MLHSMLVSVAKSINLTAATDARFIKMQIIKEIFKNIAFINDICNSGSVKALQKSRRR
jgi:hypothetical protein